MDGTVSRVLGRVGTEGGGALGEVSQPSSICYDAEASCVFVVATVGVDDRRLLRYSLPGFHLEATSDTGVGLSHLDAAEGMASSGGMVFVVDTARHRVVVFDGRSLRCLGFSGGHSDRKGWHSASGEPILSSPYDVVAHDGELFVSDTHNDRIQVLAAAWPAKWIGVIGQSGHGPGQFTYPRGLAIARRLLYVCEERQVQVLTLVGEPRMILPVHAAGGLCGICTDARRVFVTDMDLHKVHVLRLTSEHKSAWRIAQERREAKLREELRAGVAAAPSGQGVQGKTRSSQATISAETASDDTGQHAEAMHSYPQPLDPDPAMVERKMKEAQRDRALRRVLLAPTTANLQRALGLPSDASNTAVMQATRLAMRLLHPDRGMNVLLRDTPKGKDLEAAFKKVNNLRDKFESDRDL